MDNREVVAEEVELLKAMLADKDVAIRDCKALIDMWKGKALSLIEPKVLKMLGTNPYDPNNERNVQRRSAIVMLRQGYESGKQAQLEHDQATVKEE